MWSPQISTCHRLPGLSDDVGDDEKTKVSLIEFISERMSNAMNIWSFHLKLTLKVSLVLTQLQQVSRPRRATEVAGKLEGVNEGL